jgi:hypothetical protein
MGGGSIAAADTTWVVTSLLFVFGAMFTACLLAGHVLRRRRARTALDRRAEIESRRPS